jgi:hypothetical protein
VYAAIPDTPILAISLLQPWATLLALWDLAKSIETRSFAVKHRGLLAIHASKGERDLWEFFKACERKDPSPLIQQALAVMAQVYPGRNIQELFPLGQVLAIGKLIRVERTETLREQVNERELAFGNYANNRWGWVFDDVQMLETPIPARGALGLWSWDPHYVPVPRVAKPKLAKESKPIPVMPAVPAVHQLRLFE